MDEKRPAHLGSAVLEQALLNVQDTAVNQYLALNHDAPQIQTRSIRAKS